MVMASRKALSTSVQMTTEEVEEEEDDRAPLVRQDDRGGVSGGVSGGGGDGPRQRRGRSPKVRGVADPHNRCCDSRLWCIRDCCGVVCVVFTYLLILYAEYVVVRVILLPDLAGHALYAAVNLFIFQSFTMLAVSSHLKTMLTDPVRNDLVFRKFSLRLRRRADEGPPPHQIPESPPGAVYWTGTFT